MQVGSLVLFFVAVTFTVFYAEGYRFDSKWKLAKNGVIFFEGIPDGSVLFLDSEKTDLTFPAGFSVLPGSHSVEVKSSGYAAWRKQIQIHEDELIRFPEIMLLPDGGDSFLARFALFSGPLGDWKFNSISSTGALLINEKLNLVKNYFLGTDAAQGDFAIADLIFPFPFTDLMSISDTEFIGIGEDKRLFLYNAEKRGVELTKFYSSQIKEMKGEFVGINENGNISYIEKNKFPYMDSEKLKISEFLDLPNPIKIILDGQKDSNFRSFLLDVSGKNVLAVTDLEGKLIATFEDAQSSFLDGGILFYSQDNKLFAYDIATKKIVARRDLDSPLVWMSRIGKGFHFLMLTADLKLNFCDQDFENCRNVVLKLDRPEIAVSQDGLDFLIFQSSKITRLHFGKKLPFPEKIFQELVSRVFEKSYL